MNTDSTANSGPQRLGKYELHQRLGRGGMAEVWKAWDTQLDRYVAIKILHADLQNDPEFLKRFTREARVVASLHHPNIIRIHDFQTLAQTASQEGGGSESAMGASRAATGGEDQARAPTYTAYMVMDYVEGTTLADYIRTTSRQGKFPAVHDILYLFTAISQAIDYAHQHGIIHRDIKPANILLDRRYTGHNSIGTPILTDFGIVKLLNASTATLSGAWLGTPLYISPEQAQGHPGNERSDIYSLGVILYEICTGVRPFSGDTPVNIILQHISATPTLPSLINPNIPPALSSVILRSLEKDPLARFSSASEMAEALAQALPLSTGSDSSPSLQQSSPSGSYSQRPQPSGASRDRPELLHLPPAVQDTSAPYIPQLPSNSGYTTPTSTHAPGSVTPGSAGNTNPPQHVGAVACPCPSPVLPHTQPPTVGQSSSMSNMQDASIVQQTEREESPPSVLTTSDIPPTWGVIHRGGTINRPLTFRTRRKRLFVGLLLLLILVLLGTGLGAFYLLTSSGGATPANQLAGHAYFVSTGQARADSTQGLDDMVRITLSDIPPPASGKTYYVWALGDNNSSQMPALLLGILSVQSGNTDFFYSGDSSHTDLFGTYSRLLITEENVHPAPHHPSADHSTWRYYAELPQTPEQTDNQRALDYLRYLLYQPLDANTSGAYGGLFAPFLRNTKTILQLADSAKDSQNKKDSSTIHNDTIRILDYLDGAAFVKSDVPPNTPLLVNVNGPLLSQVSYQVPIGYLERIDGQLTNFIAAPGISSAMKQRAAQADADLLNNVQTWLQQARQDAKQLATLSDAQLLQPSAETLLSHLQMELHEAYSGRLDSTNGKVLQKGEQQIYDDVQSLITFDIRPYTA